MEKSVETPIIGFAGWSGSGKTTLIVNLIPALRAAARKRGKPGLRIAVIKHDAHGLCLTPAVSDVPENLCMGSERTVPEDLYLDTEGKDSWKFRQAGADSVILCGPEGVFLSCKALQFNEAEPNLSAKRHSEISRQNALWMKKVSFAGNDHLKEAMQLAHDADWILVEGYKNRNLPQIGIARKENGKGLTDDPEKFMAVVTDDPNSRQQNTVPVFGFEQTNELAEYLFQIMEKQDGRNARNKEN